MPKLASQFYRLRTIGTIACLCTLSSCFSFNRPQERQLNPELSSLSLAEGWEISYYARGVQNARSMCLAEEGLLFVGSRTAGNVYCLIDSNLDRKADSILIIAKGLNMPNGVAYYQGDLYIAEVNKIWKYEGIGESLPMIPQAQLIYDKLPSEQHHGWKYMAIGPEAKLYFPIGAPCNICLKKDSLYSTICRMNLDGSGFEIYAHGIRNSVGFDWHPTDSALWFTDNGRDMMGDDIPADELNRAAQPGLHFGFPFFHEGSIEDPKYGEGQDQHSFELPIQKLHPHGASLGMKFIRGQMFDDDFHGDVLIAEHGSWNRSVPIGYQVSLVRLNGNEAYSYEPFISGWLNGETAWGRPVDIMFMNDGSFLVSDDFNDCIYRVHRKD